MRLTSFARSALRRRALRTTPGLVPVAIDSLVHPYRSDVLIRLQHIDFADTHRTLFSEDFASYVERARQTPYFRWWEHIAMPRYGRGRDLDASFRDRLIRTQQLTQLFSPDFLTMHPIHLRIAVAGARTETGKPVTAALHLGDGGHRLALLMHAGGTELRAHQYRVRTTPLTRVIDNTTPLAGLLTAGTVVFPGGPPAPRVTVDELASS